MEVLDVTVFRAEGGDVFNLGVGNDQSYVAGGIVVHNCDALAHADNGHGPGVYEPGSVPAFPHPRCRCFVETYDPGTGRRLADD